MKGNKTAGRIIKALGVVVALIVVLPWALYIPAVQRAAKDYACDYASKKTGMQVTMGRVLLKFPLNVSMDGVTVLDQGRDKMHARVGYAQLLDGRVNTGDCTTLPLNPVAATTGTSTTRQCRCSSALLAVDGIKSGARKLWR